LNAFAGPSVFHAALRYQFQFDKSRYKVYDFVDGAEKSVIHTALNFGLSTSHKFGQHYQVFAQVKKEIPKSDFYEKTFFQDYFPSYTMWSAGLRFTLEEKTGLERAKEREKSQKKRIENHERKASKKYARYDAYRVGLVASGSGDYEVYGLGFYYLRKSYAPLSVSPSIGVIPHAGYSDTHGGAGGLALDANITVALRLLALFNVRLTGYGGVVLSPYLESPRNAVVVGASTGLGVTFYNIEMTADLGIVNYYEPSLMFRYGITYILAPHKTLQPPSWFDNL
jgi:hypothetical protein